MTKLLHIGFSNVISVEKVVAIIAPDTAVSKRIRDEARQSNQLIDCTNGRKLRSMILTDSSYVFSSAMRPEALLQRFEGKSADTEEPAT
jgi:extracellular matrix regulatory protein A